MNRRTRWESSLPSAPHLEAAAATLAPPSLPWQPPSLPPLRSRFAAPRQTTRHPPPEDGTVRVDQPAGRAAAGLAICRRSAARRIVSCSSITKGPASAFTRTRYSSASSDGTRHEYPQVKPHPYSNWPEATTSSSGPRISKVGFGGRPPATMRLVTRSPPVPMKASSSWTIPAPREWGAS